jgi:hypothetical protein
MCVGVKPGSKKAKKCYRVNWSVADTMIKAGADEGKIAEACGCSRYTIRERRRKLKRLAGNPVLSPFHGEYFNYAERLENWFHVLQDHLKPDMSYPEFKGWLMTPEGQALLEWINQAITPDRAVDQHEEECSRLGKRRAAAPSHA